MGRSGPTPTLLYYPAPLLEKVQRFMEGQEEEVLEKADRMESQGWGTYLAGMADKKAGGV